MHTKIRPDSITLTKGTDTNQSNSRHLDGLRHWVIALVVGGAAAYVFRDGVRTIIEAWGREEYSHGYLIPVVVAYLIWQARGKLAQESFTGSWLGVGVTAVGLFLYFLGELGTLYVLLQYGFIVTLVGLVYAWLGWKTFRHIWVAMLLLFFTVPLPSFLYNNLSSQLQLISSEIGVWFIRQFGISVYLAGNVIDLGSMQLQVVEACSGLRYLFPLMTLAFIVAIFFRSAWWKKLLIFLSSIPITVIMNSVRIGVIGVLVEYWGTSMAEGFLHDFEGWVVFMAAFAVLLVEVWLFALFSKTRLGFGVIFTPGFPAKKTSHEIVSIAKSHRVPGPFVASIALLLLTLVASLVLPNRKEVIPQRALLSDFPMQIGEWHGRRKLMDTMYVEALKFDDYLLADYKKEGSPPVNFYIAYYDSQRKGASAHSPRSCLPGGGWRIDDFDQKTIKGVKVNGVPLRVNRVLMSKGGERKVVYYWFQERGRNITNEYLVKWFIFWDSLMKNRTDGALIRVTASVPEGYSLKKVERFLDQFLANVVLYIGGYVSN